MASVIGSSWIGSFVVGANVGTLNADYRTFDYNPTIELLDETAGADTNKQKVAYMKDATAKWGGLYQSGAVSGGTLLAVTCYEGAVGTLYWSPEGTGTGKPKFYQPMICLGIQSKDAYNTFRELSISWEGNGTRVEGTN